MTRGTLYERSFLDKLREDVIATYKGRERERNSPYDIEWVARTPNSDNSDAYVGYRNDIKGLTSKEISTGTLYKFLYRGKIPETDSEEDIRARTFLSKKIELLEEYVVKGLPGDKITRKEININNFQGCYVVNADFKHEMEIAAKNLIAVKFYTTKLDPTNQWLGVIKGLDYERPLLKEIEKQILLCFERRSKICAVIHGPHGAGKSTFLRKLAINCIKYSQEKFSTLWIEDFYNFHSKFLPLIIDDGKRYLIVIEDWPLIVGGYTRLNSFFNSILNSSNIKIIIGDIERSMQYTDYIYGKNVFKLEASENEDIILHVLGEVKEWQDAAKAALKNKDIYKAPLFCILFVIAKSSEEQGNILNIDTEDFVSQFRSIIAKDQQRILARYPGLAKALYYWANFDKLYAIKTTFTWEDLLKWADSYSGSQDNTADILGYNEQNPICKILSQYFEFREILNPLSPNTHHMLFLNDTFRNVFCSMPFESWYFDRSISLDIIEKLATVGLKKVAQSLLTEYLQPIIRESTKHLPKEPWGKALLELHEIEANKVLNEKRHRFLREKIELLEEPSHFEISSNSLLDFINNVYPFDGNTFAEMAGLCYKQDGYKEANAICNFLIKKGCKMEVIKDLQEASLSQETLEAYCYEHCRWYWG